MSGIVTVIIPCKDVADYVVRALDSLLPVKKDIERVVCVDNLSSDNTLEMIQLWRESNAEVALDVLTESTPKAMAARFKGLEKVKTPLVHFLDADDEISVPGWQAQLDAYEKASEDRRQNTIWVSGIVWHTLEGKRIEDPAYAGDPRIGLMRGEKGMTSSMVWPVGVLEKAAQRINRQWWIYAQGSDEYRLLFECLKDGAKIEVYEPAGAICYDRDSGRINQTGQVFVKAAHSLLRADMHEEFRQQMTTEQDRFACDQALLISLMHLSKHAMYLATALYRKHIPGFVPKPDRAVPVAYVVLLRLFGFEVANKVTWLIVGLPPWLRAPTRIFSYPARKRRP
jgi:glycosyltransferase involved in cell wall biosynthesis